MLNNVELHETLAAISRYHTTLKAQFSTFVESLESSLGQADFFVKGISVTPKIDEDQVEIDFVGRTLRLVFSVVLTEELRRPLGIIRCYALVEHPEKNLIETGDIKFKPNGESDLEDPSDNDVFYINHDSGARYIGLHFIFEALEKLTALTENAASNSAA
ncbi:hypothetical protein [Aeromonas salmonicida]|uniref:hypothetical protein n=1 Tax=Aeromonas salmonicida TaxID=645 RepID=UPI003D085DD6